GRRDMDLVPLGHVLRERCKKGAAGDSVNLHDDLERFGPPREFRRGADPKRHLVSLAPLRRDGLADRAILVWSPAVKASQVDRANTVLRGWVSFSVLERPTYSIVGLATASLTGLRVKGPMAGDNPVGNGGGAVAEQFAISYINLAGRGILRIFEAAIFHEIDPIGPPHKVCASDAVAPHQ